MKSLSIRVSMLVTLAVVFALVLVGTMAATARSQNSQLQDTARQQAELVSKSYFDSINTMMIMGSIAQRDSLRAKMSVGNVTDVRIVRGAKVNALYGPGPQSGQVQDELDEAALAGEEISQISTVDGVQSLTILRPIIAQSDYQGTNCLACHAASEGDVLGAVRVEYSLLQAQGTMRASVLQTGIVQAILFAIGFVVSIVLLNRLVGRPLKVLQNNMTHIANTSDLSHRIQVGRNDEIGQVGHAFNQMLDQFNQSLLAVKQRSEQLTEAAGNIGRMAQSTTDGSVSQQGSTEQVAAAVNQMSASSNEVKSFAQSANNTVTSVQQQVKDGQAGLQQASHTANSLNDRVQQAAGQIQQLGEQTQNINSILNVIAAITEQTNLLALNAAIESARAGEHGRGFAVVADEVRALSRKTQAATTEISATMTALQDQAGVSVASMNLASQQALDQVQVMQRVAQQLNAIEQAVQSAQALNDQMANAANEQSSVAEDVNRQITDISEGTSKNAELAKQTAQVAGELLSLAKALQVTVAAFTLNR